MVYSAATQLLTDELEKCRSTLVDVESRITKAKHDMEREDVTKTDLEQRIIELAGALVLLEKRNP
jgi:hypothetical protein